MRRYVKKIAIALACEERQQEALEELRDLEGIEVREVHDLAVIGDDESCEGCVFLTDDENMAARLERAGRAYLIWLHEGNMAAQFPSGAYCIEEMQAMDEEYLERVYRRKVGIPWDIVSTERLLLREITVEDVPRLYELYEDPEITQYMEPLFPTMEQELAYTRDYIRNIYAYYGYGMWLITLKKSGLVIGRAGIEYKSDFDGLELGFMLGKAYQGQGYAYEACQAVLEYARTELEETQFHAFVHTKNITSQHLCEKLGFTVRQNGEYIEYCIE